MLKISIDTAKKINSVSPLLYGIFFEDINYAGDGGLYGELIANPVSYTHLTLPTNLFV